MIQFDKIMKDFGKFMDQFSQEIDPPKQKKHRKRKSSNRKRKSSNRKNYDGLIWGESNNSLPIWGSSGDDFDSQAQIKSNLEKIWGRRH
jgi:hypothetical protein